MEGCCRTVAQGLAAWQRRGSLVTTDVRGVYLERVLAGWPNDRTQAGQELAERLQAPGVPAAAVEPVLASKPAAWVRP